MSTTVVIPARFGSKRLPGKPLLRQTGKFLVQHVYERVSAASNVNQVIVATDDPRIEAAVRSFGGSVVRTRRDHESGTDRVAEVARNLRADVIVNVQGDEPLVNPADLGLLGNLLKDDPLAEVATLAVPVRSKEEWLNPNVVKVVRDDMGRALYFSRSPIPFVRDAEPIFSADSSLFLKHVGLYAYRRDFLERFTKSPPSRLERLEKLEQLRVLEMGRFIRVGITDGTAAGVDTLEDYERFVSAWRFAGGLRQAA